MSARQNTVLRLAIGLGAVASMLAVTTTGASAAGGKPAPGGGGGTSYVVEQTFSATGPWAVATRKVPDIGNGMPAKIHYPANLGAGGFQHPVITWGNGTNATPADYASTLNHLASWGFVVVAADDPTTATGQEMLDALSYVLNLDAAVPSSPFYNKLDEGSVGAIGHSQGAGGAINAANKSGGLIDTTVPISLPDWKYVDSGGEFSVSDLRVPVFFLGGAADKLVAPPATLVGYFGQLLAGTPGALGILKNGNHNTIQRADNGLLGYLTAWMMYELRHDATAARAFTGLMPELKTNTNWQNQTLQNLL